MKGIEHIGCDGETFAIIVRHTFSDDGIEFFTPNEYSQQLAYMNRPAGYRIEPHTHNVVSREIKLTQEVLFVRKGRVKVDFYTSERRHVTDTVLESGDVILLASGGHGFTMLEPTEMIEVKQGPFLGESDKTRFDPDTGKDI